MMVLVQVNAEFLRTAPEAKLQRRRWKKEDWMKFHHVG
jgi:hypothetical protein